MVTDTCRTMIRNILPGKFSVYFLSFCTFIYLSMYLSFIHPSIHSFIHSLSLHRAAQSFMREESVNWWKTPAESPDMNPIENLWHEGKEFFKKGNKASNQARTHGWDSEILEDSYHN